MSADAWLAVLDAIIEEHEATALAAPDDSPERIAHSTVCQLLIDYREERKIFD